MAYYFDKETNVTSNEKMLHVEIKGQIYKFYTDNNVFSKKYLDFGTRTLLESIDLTIIKGDVLDFGCGYGPIGIYIKKICDCNVDMIDINDRALNLARKNGKLNKVDVNIFESDIYSNINKKYDNIITNPPIRVGKKVLYEILFKAKEYLKEKGCLYLVINKDQGAKSLYKDLQKVYSVTILEKNKGFYIFKCQKNWLIEKLLLKL